MRTCPSCGEENSDRARFCQACATSLAPAEPSAEVRKVVTIVFADVTGSTALGERLDPETLRRVMSRYDAMVLSMEGRADETWAQLKHTDGLWRATGDTSYGSSLPKTTSPPRTPGAWQPRWSLGASQARACDLARGRRTRDHRQQ